MQTFCLWPFNVLHSYFKTQICLFLLQNQELIDIKSKLVQTSGVLTNKEERSTGPDFVDIHEQIKHNQQEICHTGQSKDK